MGKYQHKTSRTIARNQPKPFSLSLSLSYLKHPVSKLLHMVPGCTLQYWVNVTST